MSSRYPVNRSSDQYGGYSSFDYLNRVMRKPEFCLIENKGTDQFRSHCEADQRFGFVNG